MAAGQVMLAIDPILSLAHSMCSSKGIYAVLIGSGVSRSAGIPTGWDVTLGLVRELARLEGKDSGNKPDEWHRREHGLEPDYSVLLEALARTPAERRNLLQRYFEPTPEEREQGQKAPTAAHRAIASLVESGHVRVVVTTNFDRLMETALADVGVTPTVISNGDQAEGAAPLVHQRCVVLKLHGDYLDDRIMNTEAELAAYDPRMAAKLDQILGEFGLVVSGWSGEWDPALRAAFERCPSRRYATYWSTVGEPGPRAASLIVHRQAQIIRVAGADAFFTSLEEKVCGLEEMRTAHPLSVAAAVAALKRHIAEDRFRIRLDDLVRNEAIRAARAADELLPRSTSPTEAGMIAAVRTLDAETEILRSLFFHGCRLAAPDQEDVLVRALTLMAPREQWIGGPVYTVWAGMRFYPMSSALYAAALGALCARNWRLLRTLLTLDFRAVGEDRRAAHALATIHALPEAAAKALYPRHKTPASDHMFDLVGSLAADFVPDADALFDELEVWLGLAAAEGANPTLGIGLLIPPGRFMWKGFPGHSRGQPDQTFSQAEQAGAAWVPLAAGWFGGDPAAFQKAKDVFQTRLGHLASRYW